MNEKRNLSDEKLSKVSGGEVSSEKSGMLLDLFPLNTIEPSHMDLKKHIILHVKTVKRNFQRAA